jgi:carboxypeptidase C (cathepsin A)
MSTTEVAAGAAENPKGKAPENTAPAADNFTPIITHHSLNIKGKVLNYTATTGMMKIVDEEGKHKSSMFYVAYTKDGQDVATRPLTFAFNGGPGSSSVWLHMGALGPKRVVLTDKGDAPPPPYTMVDNEFTWLEFTDLIFIDPVGTGYSRPAKEEKREQFHGVDEDIASVGNFIRLYTTQSKRWLSPKFLAGESYGTTRAAGLADHLQDRYGLYVNGILLISMVLDFQTLRFSASNELPYILFLPTYTATALYYNKLSPALQANPEKTLSEVREWAITEYITALAKGDMLPEAQKKAIAAKLAAYTGLSSDFILRANNRIEIFRFTKELLRDERRTVGRLDSRFKGIDRDAAGENPEFDPSYNSAIYGPFTAVLHHYLRAELGYENDMPYEILTGKVHPWNWGSAERGFPSVAESLREAMSKNHHLKVFVANGYYDLATPFFAAEYSISHMQLDPALRENISMEYYKAGHMMYVEQESLKKMTRDIQDFILKSCRKP